MAKFTVETTPEEQEAVIKALKQIEGETVAVRVIAELANMSQSRTRYAIIDLLDARKIERIPAKAFNKRYIRYYYKVL